MPIVSGLEKTYRDRISFTRVNIMDPKNQPVMDHYGFSTAPELYLVNPQGRIIGAWDDFVASADLKQAFDTALRANN